MRAAGAIFACALLSSVLSSSMACKKNAPPAAADAAPNEPVVGSTAETTPAPAPYGDPMNPAPHGLPLPEEPRENIDIQTGTTTTPGTSATAVAPPPDPFASAENAVRQSAVGCFAGQPAGEYSATISVVVTPAGTATRVEATSSVNDPAVIKCLEQAGTRSYPSSTDGRKLAIDVRVKG